MAIHCRAVKKIAFAAQPLTHLPPLRFHSVGGLNPGLLPPLALTVRRSYHSARSHQQTSNIDSFRCTFNSKTPLWLYFQHFLNVNLSLSGNYLRGIVRRFGGIVPFLTFIIFNIHSYDTIIQTYILHPWPSPSFCILIASPLSKRNLHGVSSRELNSGLPYADALPTELRRNLMGYDGAGILWFHGLTLFEKKLCDFWTPFPGSVHQRRHTVWILQFNTHTFDLHTRIINQGFNS